MASVRFGAGARHALEHGLLAGRDCLHRRTHGSAPFQCSLRTLLFAREKAKRIVEEVAREHDLTAASVCGSSGAAHIVTARAQAIRRVERETQLTLKQIGHLFGGLDHSTVIHHLRNGAAEPKGEE